MNISFCTFYGYTEENTLQKDAYAEKDYERERMKKDEFIAPMWGKKKSK